MTGKAIKNKTYNSEFKGKTRKYHSPPKKLHSHSIVTSGLLEASYMIPIILFILNKDLLFDRRF
jgi:hypothetical protein